MNRREVITFLGGAAAAWPLAALAQQGERMRRVGVLVALAENDPQTQARLGAFRNALGMLGWSENRNIHIDYRFAAAGEQASLLAKELVALQPDVILGNTTVSAAALQHATSTIPIVFTGVSDPIGSGFVANLAQPGGNLTGFLSYEATINGKWLAMLKEIEPSLARAALMANPKTSAYDYYLRTAQAVAPSIGIELVPSPIATAADIERTIQSLAQRPNSGLVVPPDDTTIVHRDLVIALTARYRLPAVYGFRFFVAAGGLMSYGIDSLDQLRKAASYVDRILRGEKPSQLPVQAPTKYETAVNLKAVQALGLTVPPGLLVAADEVIE